MSEYEGFITYTKFDELRNMLRRIADIRGLENKLHHLYQPDTDMNDKICENFETCKELILLDIQKMINDLITFVFEIKKLRRVKNGIQAM